MIDHIGLSVSDYSRLKDFYAAALAPLGYAVLMEFGADETESGAPACGLGRDGHPSFFIGGEGKTHPFLHLAFGARSRAQVDSFYAAAIAAGATDNGPAGPRPHYGPNYYAAFVHDPDGHNLEACFDEPVQ